MTARHYHRPLIIAIVLSSIFSFFQAEASNNDSPSYYKGWGKEEVSNTLPIVHVNTQEGQPITDKENYINASFRIEIPQDCGQFAGWELGTVDEPLEIGIRGRGNSSWNHPDKKPYKIKFPSKTSVLGMPKNKHFALMAYANSYTDWLDQCTGRMLAEMVELGWTPRQHPVELVLNGKYVGLYFLSETVRIGSGRLDIFEQEDLNTDPELIPYGWLVEIDNTVDECQIVFRDNDANALLRYHTPEDLSPEQLQWLTDEFTAIGQAPYGDNTDSWADYIDPASMAKYFIVREVMTDLDGFNGSVYMYRDKEDNARWHMGPMWDVTCNARGRETICWTAELVQDDPDRSWKLMPGIFQTKTFQDAFLVEWEKFYARFPELKEKLVNLKDLCFYGDQNNATLYDFFHAVSDRAINEYFDLLTDKVNWIEEHKNFYQSSGIEDEPLEGLAAPLPESIDYFSLDGKKLCGEPGKGMFIRTTRYSDGHQSSELKATGR